ncbi:hypothetical protein SAMN05444671_2914 [Flavobacterium sp. CF108]|jgi:hypothetical protein|uniref:hypothetical protein n=1 Tax=unclassified Flavobacterium TaxID=196869 RepID=UPI0008D53284|nr:MULTISPECIES: hypothetical protein [unclassified Flavobacterium]SEP15213.1 hypothetical protein SAMN04487978_4623 [Flavobacterium sp. fv08]SHH48406.1 hypothetical protein SAMN05444671_2914 [Flavobacterium sp. CF108]
MKKLILSAAILLGGLSIQAENTVLTTTTVNTINDQDDYKEVDAVPAAIKKSLDEAYPGVKLEKAYVNSKKEYKIEVTVRGEKSIVYTDAAGTILKK